MRIQHNIMALNAYRQLGGNNSALAKNLEKLSSGYAINRAGDDAAGLAISEKMRAQIKGLEAAQKNANDGISLVQTAEGALTEVHSMLNRMVYLATQSANGTYDNEVDRANLDKEVQTLKEEIDRISKSTNFNGLNLLDGSMDGDATQTTGGTTDVPILQEAATNPTQEVGTKTVLHKDAAKEGKTVINADLHNVAITAKAQAGDSVQFKVGDAVVELKVKDATDPDFDAQYDIAAGTPVTTENLATLVQNYFNDKVQRIGGQDFTATAIGDKITFEQNEIPADDTEVVDANVDIKLDYVKNPAGNKVEYTTRIDEDALLKGSTISIGGDEITLGEGEYAGKDTLTEVFAADANGNPFETKSGYQVEYDATTSTLKVTDPNGTLGAPVVKFDEYGSAVQAKLNATAAKDDIKASTTINEFGTPATGDTIEVGGEKYKLGADGNWAADAAVTDPSYKVTTTAQGIKVEHLKVDGEAGNATTFAVGDVKYTKAKLDGANALSTTAFANGANSAGGGANDGVPASASLTLTAVPAANDEIKLSADATAKFDGTSWTITGANADKLAVTGTGKTLTITKGDANDGTDNEATNGTTLTGIEYTYAEKASTVANSFSGGIDATSASTSVDKVSDGSKVTITNGKGKTMDIIIDTDWKTTLAKEGEGGAGTTVADDIATFINAGNDATKLTNGETFTVAEANGKLVITSDQTGEAGVEADGTTIKGSHTAQVKVSVSQAQNTTAEMTTASDAATIVGTWNVQSTQNTQGASKSGGQLASTVFDLTADMVKDGNKLTIGKDTYVFKVGADSTVKAGAGETLIDLSAYKADDEGLIDAAGATLANQSNKAFTIGYADHGKISIHEIQGQTAYKDGELSSVEEFDKLVYMQSPEVTTATGKGLTFQVGDTADDFQKVTLNIKDMSSEGLGIGDVSIGTIDDATAAIAKIKDAINTVSSQRGDLGAIQNRLEHTINNLGVQTENITAAESRIRDTDMAEEMMAYTKNNILVQAAQAMLAQANQVPQGILQLLQ